MKRSTRGRRPPKHQDAGSTREPTPTTPRRSTAPPADPTSKPTPAIVVEAFVREATVTLRIAASGWGKVAKSVDGEGPPIRRPPIEQMWLAVYGALLALVRLLAVWETPEGTALLRAARILGELRWFARMRLEPPAALVRLLDV